MKQLGLVFFSFICICLGSCADSTEIPQEVLAFDESLPETVDYNQHIKPILSDRCFKCHGPDKTKIEAGLQLASFDGATMELKSGATAIDPGEISSSELINRILSKDPDLVMPTPNSHLTLTDEEKALLIKWIRQGAEYQEHWSLAKIKQPEVPRVGKGVLARWGLSDDEETRWVKNEIDHFVMAKLKEKGLKPSARADKYTLLRRVYMDLTGLPPTPAEIDAFVNDQSANAYEKVVDKLLASPHFGEQQAVSWLDLARYADSNGYQDDALRTIYPYRDWVIRSFNENLPFDKFITYQLAGDLLPNPDKDMMIATAFNRNHSQSEEDGIVPEEYQVEYVADRTNTFGKAFLGLTMECSRCHDHKYDPISQKDYYSMFAFFNNINEHGQSPHMSEASPIITLPTPAAESRIRFIKQGLAKLDKDGQEQNASLRRRFETWLAKGGNAQRILADKDLLVDVSFDFKSSKRKDETGKDKRHVFKNVANDSLALEIHGDTAFMPVSIKGPKGRGLGVKFVGDGYLKIHETNNWWKMKDFDHRTIGNFERNQPFSVSLWVGIIDPKFKGQIFNRNSGALSAGRGYECRRLEDGRLAFSISNVWPDDAIDFETDEVLRPNRWTHITFSYDGTSKASGMKVYIDGKIARGRIMSDHLTGSLIFEKNREIQKSYSSSTNFSLGRMHTTINKGYAVDELKIFGRVLTPLEVQSEMAEKDLVNLALAIQPGKRSTSQTDALFDYYKTHIDPVWLRLNAKREMLIGQEVEILNKEIDIMVSRDRKYPRKTYILNRGVYDAPGEEVIPETPLKIGKLPESYPRNRLGLTQWLLSEDNPLFARVMANRFWQQYLGNGLVKTQEDFGSQGELPSHPELLDWLAVKYREGSGEKHAWDTKDFIRRIVLSATYQQSSIATKEQIEADPDNRWLARGSSYRFSAEQIRDNALLASGLLVRDIGGPSVYPYQPAGIWEALATRNVTNYKQQHGDNLYRRSMYTIWKRTSPPPMMLNFDSPDRSLCTVRRQKTATPLQALVTLNDPQFVEAARVLAQRTIKRPATFEARVKLFFRSVVSRDPRVTEIAILKNLYRTELQSFLRNPALADSLLATGEYQRDNSLNGAELAAYTVVANTILNYDEAIVKR
ncbi:hypothetical protein GCM10010967_24210 [Dyadobacter beijingensis]|uniref:Cytochrome c n=1 Tax=Dyadobacter beijingensis TaxID=365489 RepID=A0ABQ2HUH4_9BACT|nr:DUF1553 domain-containing protein [Dyadobacter beijingensis]GGM90372.1 hypothetical protein GCM10010967_24210 [Dyadobacter beijingensis]